MLVNFKAQRQAEKVLSSSGATPTLQGLIACFVQGRWETVLLTWSSTSLADNTAPWWCTVAQHHHIQSRAMDPALDLMTSGPWTTRMHSCRSCREEQLSLFPCIVPLDINEQIALSVRAPLHCNGDIDVYIFFAQIWALITGKTFTTCFDDMPS